MGILIIGLTLFLGVHSVSIVNEPWRDRLAARVGELPYKVVYSLVAITGLVFIVWGYGLARGDAAALYDPPRWLRHISLLVLVPMFPLLLATYLPGCIRTAVGHPMLLATMLWASAHLFTNGSTVDTVLFGSFLAWAMIDWMSLKRRKMRSIPTAPPTRWNDAIAVTLGLGIYASFMLDLHRMLIGVSPLG